MKKLISVLLSITLAVLCFSSLVLSADTAETAQDGRSYVIWEANPLNLSKKSLFCMELHRGCPTKKLRIISTSQTALSVIT